MGHLTETRAFFGPRAASWDERFPDDEAAFVHAVGALAPPRGGVTVDVGCGTGRALPHLRRAIGSAGTVLGVDATPEMCAVAHGRDAVVVGDAGRLPLPDAVVDAVLAAGLLTHLDDPHDGLLEFARVTRLGGALGLFHPIGRAALAARHGHDLDPSDIRDPANLPTALGATGWALEDLDDCAARYLAVARRV